MHKALMAKEQPRQRKEFKAVPGTLDSNNLWLLVIPPFRKPYQSYVCKSLIL